MLLPFIKAAPPPLKEGFSIFLESVSDSISNPGQGVLYGDIPHKTELGRCKQDGVSLHYMNGLQ